MACCRKNTQWKENDPKKKKRCVQRKIQSVIMSFFLSIFFFFLFQKQIYIKSVFAWVGLNLAISPIYIFYFICNNIFHCNYYTYFNHEYILK